MSDSLSTQQQQALEKLKTASDDAVVKYPASCSHAVWHVIKAFVPEQPFRVANELVTALDQDRRWKPVPVAELAERASRGELIVGGLKTQPNGHVIVVYPGLPKPAGGYAYTSGGKSQTMRPRGMYARAMSTSLGGWAGAKSNGDETVWDSWANDTKFAEVKFWRLETASGQ